MGAQCTFTCDESTRPLGAFAPNCIRKCPLYFSGSPSGVVASWAACSPDAACARSSTAIPTGTARLRYPVAFYLVAIFFLIFDVEGAFIFAWAIAHGTLGWAGWLQISFFIVLLLLGLLYIWRKGGLDWGPITRRD